MAEYRVPGPDGKVHILNGPEGIPMEVLQMDLQKHLARQEFLSRPQPTQAAEPRRSGIVEEAKRSARNILSSSRTGIEALLGDPRDAVGRGVDRADAIAADYGTPPSLAGLRETYQDEGLWEAVKEGASQVPRFVAQQAPVLAQLAAGAKLGAMAMPVPQLKPLAGAVTAAGSFIPMFAGSNLERRAEEQVDAGEQLDLSVPGAYLTATGQAAAEGLGGAAILGKRLVSSLLGVARDVPQDVAERELRRLAQRGALASAGMAAARGAGVEMPTEVIQQMLERNYAGLPLADEDAMREYGEAMYAAAISGGAISGTLGSRDGARARRQLEDLERQDVPARPEQPVQPEDIEDLPEDQGVVDITDVVEPEQPPEGGALDAVLEELLAETQQARQQTRAENIREIERDLSQRINPFAEGQPVTEETAPGVAERAVQATEPATEVPAQPEVEPEATQVAEPAAQAQMPVVEEQAAEPVAEAAQPTEVAPATEATQVTEQPAAQLEPEAVAQPEATPAAQPEATPAVPATVTPEEMENLARAVNQTISTANPVALREAFNDLYGEAPSNPKDAVKRLNNEDRFELANALREAKGQEKIELPPALRSAAQPKQTSNITSELNRSFERDLQRSNTTQELLGNIANNKLVPQPLRNLARQLRSVAPNVNVPVELVEMEGADIVGEYVPPERGRERILLDPRSSSVPQTFMHEFVHPVTYDAIRRKTPAGRRVIALYDQFKSKYPDVTDPETGEKKPAFYGLTDPFEFVSEGLTNPKFQAALKKRNLWERFVDAIRGALGLPVNQNKVIDELLDLTKEMAVGADQRFIAQRNELADAITTDTVDSAKRFFQVQGAQLRQTSTTPSSDKAKRAVSTVMGTGGSAGRKVLAWGLPLPALNDYVQNYVRKRGSGYVPFADSVKRFTEIAIKSEGELRQFIDSITAQLARMGEWRNSNPSKYQDFADLYFGGTEARVDLTKPATTYTGNKRKAYDRLKKVYDSLGADGQAIYKQMRAIHNRQFGQIKQLVYDKVYSETKDREMASSISNTFTQHMRTNGPLEGYAPLVRPNGKYMLSYPVEGKEELGFEIFTNEFDRKQRIAQLKQDGIAEMDIKPFLGDDTRNFEGVVPGSFLGDLVKTLEDGKASKELVEAVMSLGVSMSPSSMVLNRLASRRDVPGYTRDPFEAFQQGTVGLGKRLVNLKYGAQMSAEIRDMEATRKNVGDDPEILDLVQDFKKRAQYAANPAQSWWSNVLTTGTYGWTLGFNVSSSIVDFSSIALVTGPFLAKFKDYNYGWGKTSRAMIRSAKDIMGMGTSADVETLVTAGLEGDALKAVQQDLNLSGRDVVTRKSVPSMLNINFDDPSQARKHGYLQPLVRKMQEYGHSERFSDLEEVAEFGEGNLLSKWSARMGFMMNTSERLKREIGLKAAYDLELERLTKGARPTQAQLEAAAQKALDMSLLLNGGSTAVTGARFQQGDFSRVAFMYRRFAALQMYLQARTIYDATANDDKATRDAARSFAFNAMLTSAAFVGVKGMPMMGAVASVWGIMGAVFGDEDEDNSFEGMLRRNLDPILVEGVPNVLFNANVGQRMELTNLLYRESNLPDDATLADHVAAHFGGPAAGTMSRIWRGKQLIEQGEVQRGVESMMPASVAGLLKSGRFLSEGAIETVRGDEVVPVSFGGALAQALGFAPADYARAMTFKTTEARVDRRMAQRRTELMEAVYAGYRVGDAAVVAKAMEKIVEFNNRYPEYAITSQGLRQSVRTRDRNTQQMIMGTLPSERRRLVWEESAEAWGF